MTTSGSVIFTINEADVIHEALDACGLYDPAETVDAHTYAGLRTKLNLMVKAWMAQGLHIFALTEATMFLQEGVARYSLNSTGDRCTNTYVQTTLSADAAAAATTISLTATTDMTNGDQIGIMLDDGSLFWTTIVNKATTTITAGLTSAASSGNTVFTYTSKINRPQRILSAYRRTTSLADAPMEMISRMDYAELSYKSNTGSPIQFYYDPQLATGYLTVWPTPADESMVVRFWYERPLEDFVDPTDTPDFPIEWGESLIWGLAKRAAPSMNIPLNERAYINGMADQFLSIAMGYDREEGPVQFVPDFG